MIFLFTSDQYEMLYIFFFLTTAPPPPKKKENTSWTCFNAYDKKEM